MSSKYNRTFHFPWSKGASNDDKISKDVSYFLNKNIVLTEKLDGGSSSLESDNCYARSHAGPPTHKSFDLLKAFHASIKHLIPKGYQLFGENLFAVHSIYYDSLPNYFLLFAVRDDQNKWLSWEDVCLWASEINVPTVPVLWTGKVNSEKELEILTTELSCGKSEYGPEKEGLVARIFDGFEDKDFSKCVAKIVRQNHVSTDEHWAHKEIVPNKLSQTN